MKRFLFVGLFLLLAAGCTTPTFVYKPGQSEAGVARMSVKLAVLPFADETEDFTRRGSFTGTKIPLEYNLAKAGWGSMITALTPELWAKGFADELAASGTFQAVRFAYELSELTDEEYFIVGRMEKASTFSGNKLPNEFALGLEAVRRVDNRKVWSKSVSRKWTISGNYDGCVRPQCFVDLYHMKINEVMQSIFAEASTDLVRTLAPLSGARGGQHIPLPAAAPQTLPAGESVDREIEKILKGN